MTPFSQGQRAYRDGKTAESNPYPPKLETGNNYPGAYHNWLAGWRTEKAMVEHDRKRA